MDFEELSQGDPDGPDGADGPRIRPIVWVALALVCVLVGYLALGRDGASNADPTPVSTRRSGPAPTILRPTGPGQRQFVALSEICTPVTNHRTRLSVTFQLSNISPFDAEVTAVNGVLPTGGLRQRGPATAGGSCHRPGKHTVAGALAPQESRYYTVNFDLPKRCPTPYPIQVLINFDAVGFSDTNLSLIEPDLGLYDFSTCPKKSVSSG